MIVCNGIVGLCLLWAAYAIKGFPLHGASAALAALIILAGIELEMAEASAANTDNKRPLQPSTRKGAPDRPGCFRFGRCCEQLFWRSDQP